MRPSFEVADALRLGLADYEKRHGLSAAQGKAVRAILNCRTAALGGHVRACTGCGLLSVSYNSCRHRCCPKCQGTAQAKWVERRMEELLDTQYFHLVFTVPHLLNPLFLSNDTALYNLLLRCAWQTLDELARQPRWLGARTGMLAVLHTWGQKLDYHPHAHCIVPGGGLDAEGKWKAAKNGFFVPVRVLSALFRGKFLAGLKNLRKAGSLQYHGSAAGLAPAPAFADLLGRAYRTNWVAYAKAPMSGPAQVLRYLGRYTHRVAIGNHRILEVTAEKVTFSYKDRADGDRQKLLTLDLVEFVRRFLLHVLPAGFHKIRYFGLTSIRNRKGKLLDARRALKKNPQQPAPGISGLLLAQPPPKPCCPACGAHQWVITEAIAPTVFRPTQRCPAPARAPPQNTP